MQKPIFLFILLAFTVISCSEDNPEEYLNYGYPTLYCLLSEAERNELYDEFDHDLKIYFEIDSFGYLDRNWEPSLGDLFAGKLNDPDSAVQMAKQFIFRNPTLTGVQDTSELVVEAIHGRWSPYGDRYKQINDFDVNNWWISFQEQKNDGIPVLGTNFRVYLSPSGVYGIINNWYAEIVVPYYEQVSFYEAKETLIGKSFYYYDWTGLKGWTIVADDFYLDDEPEKTIVPFRNGDCIEMRVCWLIRNKSIWNFYVDVITGELVHKEQTIIF